MDTKKYKMLKTLQVAKDGLNVELLNKDSVHELTTEVATNLYHLGAIEEHAEAESSDQAEGDLPKGSKATAGKRISPADARETKVTAPDETKEGEAGVDLDTQNIEELVATARDVYGLDVDSTMSVEDVKAAIEAADSAAPEGKKKKTKK